MKTRALLPFLASTVLIGFLTGCESAPPSEDEIKAALKTQLNYMSESVKRVNAVIAERGQPINCDFYSALEVTSSGAEPAQVAGDKAIVKVHPTFTYTKDFTDITKEQKCGIYQTEHSIESLHGKVKKGVQLRGPDRVNATTQTLTFGKFKDGWKLLGDS